MSDYEPDQIEAIQTVVNHVSAYQDGAEQSFVESELRRGFDEVAIEVEPEDITKLAEAIHEDNGDVSVEAVLG